MNAERIIKKIKKEDYLQVIVFLLVTLALGGIVKNQGKLILLGALIFVLFNTSKEVSVAATIIFMLYLVKTRRRREGFLGPLIRGTGDAVKDVTTGAVDAAEDVIGGVVTGAEDLATGITGTVDSIIHPGRRLNRYTTQGKHSKKNNDQTADCDAEDSVLDDNYDMNSIDYDRLDKKCVINAIQHCGSKSQKHHHHDEPHNGSKPDQKKNKKEKSIQKKIVHNMTSLSSFMKDEEKKYSGLKELSSKDLNNALSKIKKRVDDLTNKNKKDMQKYPSHLRTYNDIHDSIVNITNLVDNLKKEKYEWTNVQTKKCKHSDNNKMCNNAKSAYEKWINNLTSNIDDRMTQLEAINSSMIDLLSN